MTDKFYAPRMREQYKDNAHEVLKNLRARDELRQEQIRSKAVDTKEKEEARQDDSPIPTEASADHPLESGATHCDRGPDCGPDCGCFASK